MASRFPSSNLHNRDPRSSLFDSYTGDRNRAHSASPSNAARGYNGNGGGGTSGGMNGTIGGGLDIGRGSSPGFRSATPNSKGQYSDALLSSLESQNDEQISVLSDKVRQFKDMTLAIGDEIRSSSSLADKMNDSFDNTRVRLKGTMNRMLRMAQRTGIGWRVWLGFFAAVILLFWWVWLG